MQTKETQGKLWSTAAIDWMKFLEPTFIPLYEEVLNNITLNDEKMLLDAGCGAGLFLSMAATTGVVVHGIDAAPGMLDFAKDRLPGATLMTEDLEGLPYIDGTFDVVTGFNSFQHAGSFQNALTEAARVVKRHGKVVIGLWGKEEDCESGRVLDAIAALLPPPPPGTPGPYAWSEEGKVEATCNAAGLKVTKKATVFCPWQFTGDEELMRAFLSTSLCVKAVQLLNLDTVKNTIIRSAQPFNLADDVYYMHNYFTYYITEKK